MHTMINVLDYDKIIEFIKSGHVVVRNGHDAQVYDVYGAVDRRPSVSFENNWCDGEFVLYMNGRVVAGFNYANTPEYKTMQKYQDLVSVMDACVVRCREQADVRDGDDKIGISGYRKNVFAKFIQKMCYKSL